MPQITLEYSQNLRWNVSFSSLFLELHHILADVAEIAIENCKSRAVCHGEVFIGEGVADNSFAHLTIGLYQGRPAGVKLEIGRRALGLMQRHLVPASELPVPQITVEFREFRRSDYLKLTDKT